MATGDQKLYRTHLIYSGRQIENGRRRALTCVAMYKYETTSRDALLKDKPKKTLRLIGREDLASTIDSLHHPHCAQRNRSLPVLVACLPCLLTLRNALLTVKFRIL